MNLLKQFTKLLSFLLILLCVTGCSNGREVNLVRAGSYEFNHGSTYIIDSLEELDEYVSHTYNNFNQSVEKYEKSYFEKSAIVIVEITKSTGSSKLKVSSVNIKDTTMVIRFNTRTPNIVTCDMAYWHIIIECTQEEIKGIETIKVYDSGNIVNNI